MTTLSIEVKENLSTIANTIRGLSMDGVEAAGCGHPGLPLGCAEIGAYLYGQALSHCPAHAQWDAHICG